MYGLMGVLSISGLLATLVAGGGDQAASPTPPLNEFAPLQCPYRVLFPAAPTTTETDRSDGTRSTESDIVVSGVRFDALCIGAVAPPNDRNSAPSDPHAAIEKIEVLAQAIGVQNQQVQQLPNLSCYGVQGDLSTPRYRIAATLCVDDASTFIAEIIYPSDAEIPPSFLQSLQAK
jgi:hypothetical protein